MSVLSGRIHREDYLSTPDYHPSVPGAAPITPTVMPQSAVTYANGTVLYGTLHPLVTTDGATVPAHADVTYPAVVPAGRR